MARPHYIDRDGVAHYIVSGQIPEDLNEAVKERQRRTGENVSEIVRSALRESFRERTLRDRLRALLDS